MNKKPLLVLMIVLIVLLVAALIVPFVAMSGPTFSDTLAAMNWWVYAILVVLLIITIIMYTKAE